MFVNGLSISHITSIKSRDKYTVFFDTLYRLCKKKYIFFKKNSSKHIKY